MVNIACIQHSGGASRICLAQRNEVFPAEAQLTVFDRNTAPLFTERDSLLSLSLPPGEKAKNWASVESILRRMLTQSLGRDGVIAGLGGGVVSDLTAFAASVYMRGCRLILVPTTLLSMVDAAIGGKTGFDYGGAKNIVGSFYPAGEVRICPALLKTLPDVEFRSGMAEVIKHAVLAPAVQGELWEMVKNERQAILSRDSHVLERLIPAAVKVKTDIVSDDLRESGRRAFLNFGHTFAHALESATNFDRWTHGEAVGWGMLRALNLGERLGLTDSAWAAGVKQLISDYGFDTVAPRVEPQRIKAAMLNDKKKKSDRLRFVMMRGPGDAVLQEVPEAELDAVLEI